MRGAKGTSKEQKRDAHVVKELALNRGKRKQLGRAISRNLGPCANTKWSFCD